MQKLFFITSVGAMLLLAGFFAGAQSMPFQGDVKSLQIFLNTHTFLVAKTGPGSPGNETNYLGSLTKKALADFQAAHGLPKDSLASGKYGPWTKGLIAGILEKEKNMAGSVADSKILETNPTSNSSGNSGGGGNYGSSDTDAAIAANNRPGLITSFAVAWPGGQIGGIISADHIINIEVPANVDATKLTPIIQLAYGAAVSPSSGAMQDFTNPVTYIVSGNGMVQEYIVVVVNENSG